MIRSQLVEVYDPRSAAYHRAFQVFLAHTDEKARTWAWLESLAQTLPARRVFIDVGAGNGEITARLGATFRRTIALEPDLYRRDELRRACPTAEILAETIETARPGAVADLILCSHVFYYVNREGWLAQLEKLASWLAPGGVLVVILQNPRADPMRMVEHFFGTRLDLAELADEFRAVRRADFRVRVETVPAEVFFPEFGPAYVVAEFMLNQLPMSRPPTRKALEGYVRERFADPAGGFRLSCAQDFCQIRRRGGDL